MFFLLFTVHLDSVESFFYCLCSSVVLSKARFCHFSHRGYGIRFISLVGETTLNWLTDLLFCIYWELFSVRFRLVLSSTKAISVLPELFFYIYQIVGNGLLLKLSGMRYHPQQRYQIKKTCWIGHQMTNLEKCKNVWQETTTFQFLGQLYVVLKMVSNFVKGYSKF